MNASFVNSEGASQNIFNFNAAQNSAEKEQENVLNKSRETSAATVNRTGTLTNRGALDTTVTTALTARTSTGLLGSQRSASFVGGMGTQRRRLRPSPFFKPEQQPQRQSESWSNHGNSIGCGSIIYAHPPDSYVERMKKVPKVIQEQRYEGESDGYPNHRRDTDSDYRGLHGLASGNLYHKGINVPRGMNAPSRWSKKLMMKKERPISPIEFDFRGRRVTPKQSQNVSHELPGPRPKFIADDNIIKASKPRHYNPGQHSAYNSKVGVSDLNSPAVEKKSIPSTANAITGRNSVINMMTSVEDRRKSNGNVQIDELLGSSSTWGKGKKLKLQ